MKPIKNIIFDLGGVILNLTRNRCIEAFEKLGVKNIRKIIVNNYQQKDLFMSLEYGQVTPEEFYDEARRIWSLQLSDEDIKQAWILMLDDIQPYKLDLLLKLRSKYNVVLLSNTNEIHWEHIANNLFAYKGHVVSDFFDSIYLSNELHMQKPNADIFEYVLKDSGFKAEETLLIDDALPNCKTAEALGMQTYAPKPREDWSFLFEEKEQGKV